MPLSAWIELTVDGNLKAIGDAPQDELIEVEMDLRIQYADAMGDGEYKLYCEALKEITRMEITVTQIRELVKAMREVYVKKFGDLLTDLLHTKLDFDVSKPKEYDRTLQKVLNRTRELEMRINLKRAALAQIEKKFDGQAPGKPTREYYQGILIHLSDAAGYEIKENITVWTFCQRIKQANKKAEKRKH